MLKIVKKNEIFAKIQRKPHYSEVKNRTMRVLVTIKNRTIVKIALYETALCEVYLYYKCLSKGFGYISGQDLISSNPCKSLEQKYEIQSFYVSQ